MIMKKSKKEKKQLRKRINNMKEVLKEWSIEKYEDLCELESNSDTDDIPVTVYSRWVDMNFNIDPNDNISLKVYSSFLDYPEKDLLKVFESYYERNVKTKRKVS